MLFTVTCVWWHGGLFESFLARSMRKEYLLSDLTSISPLPKYVDYAFVENSSSDIESWSKDVFFTVESEKEEKPSIDL